MTHHAGSDGSDAEVLNTLRRLTGREEIVVTGRGEFWDDVTREAGSTAASAALRLIRREVEAGRGKCNGLLLGKPSSSYQA